MNKLFLRKNSTLPKVKLKLTDKILNRHGITDEMLLDCAVTFSLRNYDTGRYVIANKCAELFVRDNWYEQQNDTKYTLVYKFTENETNEIGNYFGEFVIDFLGENGGCGKLKLPEDQNGLIIVIKDSITKTTVGITTTTTTHPPYA